jgi:hypothetical protein
MQLENLAPVIIGAAAGAVGWLLVGVYMQRRQSTRQARNAARAVYFELDVNRVAVTVARDFGSFTPLDRTSFDRLLPELATIFSASDLKTIVTAYMAHAGYRQASEAADELPPEVRKRALDSILRAHEAALATIQKGAFSAEESRALSMAEEPTAAKGSAAAPDPKQRTT